MEKNTFKPVVTTLILILQIATDAAVILNIYFIRQVLSIFYLTIVPGMVLLNLLNLHDFDLTKRLIFSVGLSIAYLMLHGFLLNIMGFAFNVLKPLSLMPLLMTLNVTILLMCLLNLYLRKENFDFARIKNLKVFAFILLLLMPLLSAVGAWQVNLYQNNFILLMVLALISVFVVLSVLFERNLHPEFYPFALFMIATALLFHNSLISNYIYGWDIHYEYYASKMTTVNSYWNQSASYTQIEFSKMNSMLSTTMLPTIYSVISNMEETWILKIVYPAIFALVPLGLYKLYENYLNKKTAFLSAFFFSSNFIFYTEMLHLTRQMIAELFLALLFLVLFDKGISTLYKKILFIIFSVALIISHYSVAYLFLHLIFFTYLFIIILRSKFPKKITLSMIVIFFTFSFSWYIYTSASSPFIDFVRMIENSYNNLFTEFFNPESRGKEVLQGLGVFSAFQRSSALHFAGRILFYITEFFIFVGFLSLIFKREKNVLFNKEFFVLIVLNMMMIVMSIALPSFVSSLRMTRFYHLLLFILSPLFVIGGTYLFKLFIKTKNRQKNKSYGLILILIVLIPFFLFQTEFIYVVLGDFSTSISLSKEYRTSLEVQLFSILTEEQDVFGARWLKRNINLTDTKLYTDAYTKVLSSYGMIPIYVLHNPKLTISNTTTLTLKDIIFLRKANTLYGIITGTFNGKLITWNITEFIFLLDDINKIYSNGGSEIYKSQP